jgi:hypothetical protein
MSYRSNSSFFNDNIGPAFGRQSGMMRERMGWGTYANGRRLMQCPLCRVNVQFIHRYKRYEDVYCCADCFDFAKHANYAAKA